MSKVNTLISATLACFLAVAMTATGAADMSSGNASSRANLQLTPEQQQKFNQLSDNSGKISKKQAKADPALSKAFHHYDTNHDGYIEPSEFAAFEAAQGNPEESNQNGQSNQ